jgi:hypothetical protein
MLIYHEVVVRCKAGYRLATSVAARTSGVLCEDVTAYPIKVMLSTTCPLEIRAPLHLPNARVNVIDVQQAFEDRVVQDAIREVLQAIYEQDFLDCSHGFRPGRSAHDAIRALDRVVHRGEVNWVLEADIVSCFDSLDRTELMKLIQIRVADGSLLRLIGKCLHVGVLDGADYTEPEKGTIQGSGLSPLLGNIYLQ